MPASPPEKAILASGKRPARMAASPKRSPASFRVGAWRAVPTSLSSAPPRRMKPVGGGGSSRFARGKRFSSGRVKAVPNRRNSRDHQGDGPRRHDPPPPPRPASPDQNGAVADEKRDQRRRLQQEPQRFGEIEEHLGAPYPA